MADASSSKLGQKSKVEYYRIHGNSSEKMRQLFHELRNIGIGGVNISYEDPDEHPGWKDYIENTANCVSEFAFRVSMHAPGGDISSIDREVRESAVARLGKSIRDIGQFLSNSIVIVHPENANPDRQPSDDDARKENCRKSLEELANSAAEHDVRIAIENMRWRADNPNRTGMYTDQLMEIIHDMDNATGICFDVRLGILILL
jgi:sugar phosphate isomerase/epimerase